MNKLDINIFSGNVKCVSLGKLTSEIVDFITDKHPLYTNILSANQDILFWKNRISHTERHKDDFFSDAQYLKCFESIPEILRCPDYISVHPKDNSISFIKDFSQHISVAIRISSAGKLSYRTMYPIMDAQLMNYIDRNRAWPFKKQ